VLYIIANKFFLTLFLLDQLEEGSDAVKILHPVSPKGIRSSLTKLYESVFLKFQKPPNSIQRATFLNFKK